MSQLTTNVTELDGSKVKIEAEVAAEEVERRVERAARALGGEMKLPGFRKGKVPAELVIQRLGRPAVFEQAIRESLPEWYEQAVLGAGLKTIGDPDLDVSELPGPGEPLRFTVEVGVRPTARLDDWEGIEVPREDVEVPDEAVEQEVDRLREAFARLEPVERPAGSGDEVVIDYSGTIEGEPFDGSEAADARLELGAEGLIEEFERALTGASAGDELEVTVDFADDHQPEHLAGKRAVFQVTVKEVREKELPEASDDFAAEASEFDTMAELREAVASRIAEQLESRAEVEFREAVLEALAERAQVPVTPSLVEARAEETWQRFERQLEGRGIDPDAYLQMQQKTREEVLEEGKEGSEKALRREAALAAVAEQEGVEVSDEEMVEALGASDGERNPRKTLEKLRQQGRDQLLADEIRLRKAADLVAERARPISKGRAEAREKLWTPGE